MKTVSHPPDAILWAYSKLLNQVFLYLRGRSHAKVPISADQLRDLGDALHNISGIISDYGAWTDDEKYRQLYIRPYDRRWTSEGFSFESFLDEKIKEYRNENGA